MKLVVLKRLRTVPVVREKRLISSRGNAGTPATGAAGELRVEVLGGATARDVADLQRDPTVEAVAPSMPVRLVHPAARTGTGTSGSPGGATWGLEEVGAVSTSRTGRGVRVAVLDTGIDVAHEAFQGLKFSESNARNFTGGAIGDVHDSDGHGTHCAGTIFGRDVGGTRIGVAPGVTDVLIAKVLGEHGGTFEAIADAIQWAHAQGAHILSMSLGMDFDAHLAALQAQDMPRAQATSQALVDYGACVRLFDRLCEFVADRNNTHRGMLVIAAAGNESVRPGCRVTVPPPADAYGIVSVAAVGRDGPAPSGSLFVAPFSNRGAHFCAPGMGVVSARAGGGLQSMDGTSMAAPHAAGVAALWAEPRVAAARPGTFKRDAVLEDLRRSARTLPHLGEDDVGAGLILAPA